MNDSKILRRGWDAARQLPAVVVTSPVETSAHVAAIIDYARAIGARTYDEGHEVFVIKFEYQDRAAGRIPGPPEVYDEESLREAVGAHV